MHDVSVLMPLYNIEQYPAGWFERSVQSVLDRQAGCNVELVIGNDASTDRTDALLKDIAERYSGRIKVAWAEYNSGGCDNLNLAAHQADGRYFILSSIRAWYEPNSLSRMMMYLDAHPEIGFVYANGIIHENNNQPTLRRVIPFNIDDFKNRFASSFGYMYRREAWDAGCRYACKIWAAQDQRWITVADRHMVMNLIFEMDYAGYAMQDLVAMHYEHGGPEHSWDITVKYREQVNREWHKYWPEARGI